MTYINKPKKKKSFLRKALKVVLILLLVVFALFWVLSFVVVHVMEGRQFARTELNTSPTSVKLIQDYEEVKTEKFTRREIEFKSEDNILRGYDYGYDNTEKKGLIILAHGFGGNQTNYLYLAKFFVENDYQVITYDNTGTVRSDGADMVALSHSPVDLKACLEFVADSEYYTGLDIITMGHSWGAYAVTDVMNYDNLPPIKTTVALSAFDYTPTMLRQFGIASDIAPAPIVNALYPTLYLYEFIKGGSQAFSHAYKGVNKASETKFMIVHGTEDELIPFDRVSLYSQRDKITNPNAVFYPLEGKDHGHVYLSLEAKAYSEQIFEQLDDLKIAYSGEELVAEVEKLQKTIDYAKINELDSALMEDVLTFIA